MTILDKVLALDLEHLTPEEIDWLHKLRNKAAAMTGRLQLKHMREDLDVLADR